MPASPAYLAALRAAMQSSAQEPDPVPSLNPQPLPPGSPIPVDVGGGGAGPIPTDASMPHPMLSFSMTDPVDHGGHVINMPVQGDPVYASRDVSAPKAKNAGMPIDPFTPEEAAEINAMGPAPGQTLASMSNQSSAGRIAAAAPGEILPGYGSAGPSVAPGGGLVQPTLPMRMKDGTILDPHAPMAGSAGASEGSVMYKPAANDNASSTAAGSITMPRMGGGGGGGVSASTIAAAKAPYEEYKAALREQTYAQEKINEDEAVGEGLRGQQLGDQLAEDKKRAAEQDAEIRSRVDKIEALSTEVAEKKINPDHWWQSQSTGNQIRFSIAAALGGFANGFSRGSIPNVAMDQINRYVDRDIMAQREAIESKRGQIGDMKGLLAETYRRYGNMNQAVDAAHVIARQQVQHQIQQYSIGSKNDLVAANGQAMQALANKDEMAAMARMTASAGAGGGNAEKELRASVQHNMDQGDDPKTAVAKALALHGYSSFGDLPAYNKKGDDKQEDRQVANDEANRQFDAMLKSPTLGEIGPSTAALSHLPSQVAPGSNKTAVDVDKLNLEMIGHASKVLKDNEGRIPPSILERLHALEIDKGDTPEKARAKIEAARSFVNSLSRTAGTHAPLPNQPVASTPAPAGFKADK